MNFFRRIISAFHKHEQTIYYILLLCIVFTFSFSRYFLRIWVIIMIVLFILNGGFRLKIQRLRHNYPLLILSSFFFLFLLGSFYTIEFNEGLKQLRVLLPWLGLPIVIGSYPKLSNSRFYLLLRVFILGVFIHTIISYLASIGLPFGEVDTFRDLGLYYSIHRFVLTIALAIFFLFYFIKTQYYHLNRIQLTGYFIVLFWLVIFLFYTKNLTGILVFVFISAIYILYILYHKKNIYIRSVSLVFLLSIVVFFGIKFYEIYNDFWNLPDINEMELPEKTPDGNEYFHDTNSIRVINGHYLYLFVCGKEMREEWKERSECGYDEKTQNGRKVGNVLKKYLTSKGLHKDSVGVSQLDESDIKAIENGIINYKYINFDFTDRLYKTAREIYYYQKKKKPVGTLTSRIYSFKEGIKIFKRSPVIGHGTRSLMLVYDNHYAENGKTGRYYIPAHNQFLQYLIEFGIIGLLWFLVAIFYPFFYIKGYKFYLFNSMLLYFVLVSQTTTIFSSQLALTIWVVFYSVFFVFFNNYPKERHKKISETF